MYESNLKLAKNLKKIRVSDKVGTQIKQKRINLYFNTLTLLKHLLLPNFVIADFLNRQRTGF